MKLRQALVDILLAEELVQEDDRGFVNVEPCIMNYHRLGLESNLCMGCYVLGR
jgi:hypothetical protein